MNPTKKIATILIINLVCINAFSRVNIGKNIAPETFSVLQLEESTTPRGLRLPQISVFTPINSKISLAGETDAKGLIVYNFVSKKLNFWEGSKWTLSGESILSAGNGLASVEKVIGLGTNLTKDTTIDLKTSNLNVVTNES